MYQVKGGGVQSTPAAQAVVLESASGTSLPTNRFNLGQPVIAPTVDPVILSQARRTLLWASDVVAVTVFFNALLLIVAGATRGGAGVAAVIVPILVSLLICAAIFNTAVAGVRTMNARHGYCGCLCDCCPTHLQLLRNLYIFIALMHFINFITYAALSYFGGMVFSLLMCLVFAWAAKAAHDFHMEIRVRQIPAVQGNDAGPLPA